VGTRPESVVKRLVRVKPPRASPADEDGGGRRLPLRGGDVRPKRRESWREDCCERKRNSSILSPVLFENAMLIMFYNTALSISMSPLQKFCESGRQPPHLLKAGTPTGHRCKLNFLSRTGTYSKHLQYTGEIGKRSATWKAR
jgi:hypothetical protein